EPVPRSARPAAEHFVAPLDETPLQAVDAVDTSAAPRSMWAEAGRSLVRNPVFLVSAVLIVLVLFVAAFPGLLTDPDPNSGGLSKANPPPNSEHPLRTTRPCDDVLARGMSAARTSATVRSSPM